MGDLLSTNKTLVSLSVFDNKLGVEGAAFMAKGLAENSTLRFLDLGCNRIRDKGLVVLARSLTVKSGLCTLNLKLNFIGDKGYNELMKRVLAIGSACNLRNLFLGSNAVSVFSLKTACDFLKKKGIALSIDLEDRLDHPNETTIFLSGLKPHQNKAFLEKYFGALKAGVIVGIEVHTGRKVKENQENLFGFVKYAHKNSVARAVKSLKQLEKE